MLKVLSPATMCGMQLKNRFHRSATLEGMGAPNGAVTDSAVELFEALAIGQVGLIIVSGSYVSDEEGKWVLNQFGIYSDEMIPGMKRLVDVAHRHGSKIACQIVHTGGRSRYLAQKGKVALSPSVLPGYSQPQRELTETEIEGIIDDFAAAAVRVKQAGFDAVQLHGGHNTILPQFISPSWNQRQDRWGGSLENRQRFHFEVVRRVRAAIGADYPLLMKFGILDDEPNGLTFDEGMATLRAMEGLGLDAVEISGGIAVGKLSVTRSVNDEIIEDVYYRERTAKVKRLARIPVTMVGGIRYLETAEDIIASGDADFIALARPLNREPGLIRRWTSGDHRRGLCISCNKCSPTAVSGEPLECREERRIREEQDTI